MAAQKPNDSTGNIRLLFKSRKKTTSVPLSRYVCLYIKTNDLFSIKLEQQSSLT